ncbi:SHOCT domain-containing protein [Candidatus Halobonum tyrrellensis]|uniref:SHOCT domain-containing protein n=1 Tax=Candidatus Halobonum tyrrellensis G22 TaxID=1324957 RepID=V4GSD8_9EURY|nr:SHOCT domain-containing protein [Candidatus Halobonum tyrrellensis]ESP88006.1 hypothetical protein K933_11126 [Candidatus Halobonum tyrrellensis G22]
MDATSPGDDAPTYAADGGDEDEEETPLQQVVAGGVTALVLLVAFALMFAGVEFFWVAFVVGFAGLLPLAVGLTRWYESRRDREPTRRGERADRGTDDGDATDEALATLRGRYARGELDEAEFETRLDALLRTESLGDARADAERRAAERERSRERERATERERDPERESEPERERDG